MEGAGARERGFEERLLVRHAPLGLGAVPLRDLVAVLRAEDRPLVPPPHVRVVEVDRLELEVRRDDLLGVREGEQLVDGRQAEEHVGVELVEELPALHVAAVVVVALDQRPKRVHRPAVGRADEQQPADVGAPAPVGARGRVGVDVAVAVHRVVAGDEAAHAVGDDVELQLGPLERGLEPVDLAREQPRVLDVVAPPVVGKDVVGIRRAVGRRGVDRPGPVAGRLFERFEQVRVDLHLGQQQREFRDVDDPRRGEVVDVRREVGRDRQVDVVVAEPVGRRPRGLTRLRVDQPRPEHAGDDDDRRLADVLARRSEDLRQVRLFPRLDTPLRHECSRSDEGEDEAALNESRDNHPYG